MNVWTGAGLNVDDGGALGIDAPTGDEGATEIHTSVVNIIDEIHYCSNKISLCYMHRELGIKTIW